MCAAVKLGIFFKLLRNQFSSKNIVAITTCSEGQDSTPVDLSGSICLYFCMRTWGGGYVERREKPVSNQSQTYTYSRCL